MVRSIMKVIANMLNSISIFTCGLFNRRKPMPPKENKEQFSSCPGPGRGEVRAAGFIDAALPRPHPLRSRTGRSSAQRGRGAGNFQVFLDRLYLKVMFRIRLHKDEINVLNKIQEFLGVGRVLIDGNSVVFIISNVKDLINVLFPLLDKYNLFTTKWLVLRIH